MSDTISIRQYIANFDAGMYDAFDSRTQCAAGWYDWFCRDTSLRNKTIKLTKKLKSILKSSKINQDTMYVFFKNNCPFYGSLYDDFRICDIATGDVIFTIVPACGHDNSRGKAYVYGRENDFAAPLAYGTWKDVKNFFMRGE